MKTTNSPVPVRRRPALLGFGLAALLGALALAAMFQGWTFSSRLAEVRERGSHVMPFDLDRTHHIFDTTEDGGVETVLVRDPSDSEQIRLIQEHLAHEAGLFSQGNFADPAAIHGAEMPGLAELEAGASRISFTYEALPDGGRISYSTADPQLVAAIHRWFAAQLSDHGHDASTGHP